jgi:glycerol-3-phosphate dehydrogenase
MWAMQRDLNILPDKRYEVLIVGGGIFGACAAWDAALRGLSVALIEAHDFCGRTSANSYKIIHGGIRYLQHADFVRLRASCHERSALLRIAPHLVQPLPILVPTYGHGKSGKAFLGAGMLLYDAITIDRNRGIADPARRVPWTRFLSRSEVLAQFPDLPDRGLTGGAVFSDGQMYNPTRLVLAFLKSAAAAGAHIANYVEAIGFLRAGDRVVGIEARDTLTGDTFPIQARAVLNTSGPWAERLLKRAADMALDPPGKYSRDACFVVRRRFSGQYALALQGRTRDPDALLSRARRHLFVVPWRSFTLIGVWHVVYDRSPDDVSVGLEELESFIDEINWAYPGLSLSLADVTMCNAGLVPFGENAPGATDLSYGKRSHIIDHARSHGFEGLVTLIGIRYTMARGDTAQAMDLICHKLGKPVRPPATERKLLLGGDIDNFENLVKTSARNAPPELEETTLRALIHNYGTAYDQILRYAEHNRSLLETLHGSTVLKAEIVNAVRAEMAQKLTDVVLRRTDLGTGGDPGELALRACAALVAQELGWSATRSEQELRELQTHFARFGVLQSTSLSPAARGKRS